MNINISQNFTNVIHALQGKGQKPTNIAKSVGYTTTAQMYKAMSGDGLLSTKAVISLIENLKVSPTYLFLGKGDMFLSEVDEIEKVNAEKEKLVEKSHELEKANQDLTEKVKVLERRNADLIDITASAVEYHKSQLFQEPELGLKMIRFLREYGLADFDAARETEMVAMLEDFLRRNKSK